MDTSLTWFESDDALMGELRRSTPAADRAPSIAGYDDLQELRRGGQGVVFLATQVSTHRRVAIKIVLDGAWASKEARRRFEREVELVAALGHPNIVQVYDSGSTEDGRLYYIMEYIEGAGLDELIEAAPTGAPRSGSRRTPAAATTHGEPAAAPTGRVFGSDRAALTVFAKICDAVQHAHQRGVIHRDLKPSNVRIDAQGEPHVLDFGLAKLTGGPAEATQFSQTGSFMGSLPWASPEQAQGATARVDVRSDVYSLGVILFQLLTGRFPYPVAGPLRDVLDSIVTSPPHPPRELRRDLDDEIATIMLKCLAKEPERRYQSAGELARDIRRYLAGEPIEAKRDSAWYALRKKVTRYRMAASVIGVLFGASLVASIAMAWLWSRASAAEQLAAQRLHETEAAHGAEIAARKATEVQVEKTAKVRDFLDTTLRSVDPWKHPGRDLGPFREMLDTAHKRLEGAFPDQPEVEAALSATLGWDYWTLGLLEAGERLLRRSFDLFQRTAGEEDPRTLSAMHDLATLLTDQGKHGESAALFGRLLEIQTRSLGPDNPVTLRTMNNVAHNLDWEGRSAEAEPMYRRALAGQRGLTGKDAADWLDTQNNLALCLPALGKMEESERLLREVIEGRIAAHGPHDPRTLQSRMNHAQFVNNSGRLEEAERLLRAVQQEIETTLGPGHPLTITATNNLASVLSARGHPDEALTWSRKAYEAAVSTLGADHPKTLIQKNEYVCTLIELQRWETAVPLARELKKQFNAAVGPADWRTLLVVGNLAFALKQMGETAEAERLWLELIEAAVPGHGASGNPVVTARANLANLWADQGRWSEAESAYRASLAAMTETQQEHHWRTGFMRCGLGRVLLETGRLDEAEKELLVAYADLTAALGDEHERTQRAIGLLVRLYEKRGDGPAAEPFRRRLSTIAPTTQPHAS